MREQFSWFLDPTEEELQPFWGESNCLSTKLLYDSKRCYS